MHENIPHDQIQQIGILLETLFDIVDIRQCAANAKTNNAGLNNDTNYKIHKMHFSKHKNTMSP